MSVDPLLVAYSDLPLLEFPFLESALVQTFAESAADAIWTLVLVLRPEDETDRTRLRLSFTNVRDLRVGPITSPVQHLRLSIVSIRDRGWEGCAYKVTNPEDLDIDFYCEGFEFTIERSCRS